MRNNLSILLLLLVGLLLAAFSTGIQANESSRANAFHTWDPYSVVGQTTLYRSEDGLKANVKINASATSNDRAFTLWFIVFNSPENCATRPCSAADLGPTAASGDFLYAGGIITTANKSDFGGSLAANDASGSGFIEFGLPDFAVGVTNTEGAEVHLILHSHGPASSGDNLKAQLSSYFGGCDLPLLGDENGFAQGPEDVPDEPGECSSVIYSIHFP